MVGGVDGEEKEGGEVMIPRGNEEGAGVLCNSKNTTLRACYGLTEVVLISTHSQQRGSTAWYKA